MMAETALAAFRKAATDARRIAAAFRKAATDARRIGAAWGVGRG